MAAGEMEVHFRSLKRVIGDENITHPNILMQCLHFMVRRVVTAHGGQQQALNVLVSWDQHG
jgi:hypothetical protein